MAKFDNWFLTLIQGFTQSKIEKAIRSIVRPLPQGMLLVNLWTEEAVGSHSSLANQWGCEIDMMDYERNKESSNHWLHRIMAGGARAIWKLRWGAECVAFSIFDWVKPWIEIKNQLSNFEFFLYIYHLHWKTSRLPKMYVCVCVCVSCQFLFSR